MNCTHVNIYKVVQVVFHIEEDNMCRQNSPVHHSTEEETAADESLLIYCKPVELYNILYRRSLHNVILVVYGLCLDNLCLFISRIRKNVPH